MKTVASILALAAMVAVAVAECPNGCSGHGTCGARDACDCYDNWMGGDCSQRVCPFGLAFVDTPAGDLDHSGSVTNANLATQLSNANTNELWQGSGSDEAHFYTECSGKGACDRATGECACFDGFTGSSCQRTNCPNDCSGHGQCFTLREIAAGENIPATYPGDTGRVVGRNFRVEDFQYGEYSTSGVSNSFDYNLWDADKNQACVCDPGFFGPDCGLRDCPRGNDPLTNDKKHCGNSACQNEVQHIYISDLTGGGVATTSWFFTWADSEDYAGLLKPLRTKTFKLRDGLTGDDYADLIQDALESFPNAVLNGATVTCTAAVIDGAAVAAHNKCSTPMTGTSGTERNIVELKVDFSNGPQGNVAALTPVIVDTDGDATIDLSSDTNFMDLQVYVTSSNTFVSRTKPDEWNLMGSSDSITIGATPATTLRTHITNAGVTAGTNQDGNQENSPCSNRGLCDYSTGQCSCFAGYTREDCSVQSALAA